ncbi:Hypothetical predicted protein [Podarcis lilfordi]|uniref:Uncharacterized protein n=1 Tax=Podarcis lilfordi TaxID=74358 RepID=A0AA35NVG9_9SAUR|nr:Hypothetical predicted protein [Podarcis lilfordi]
MCVIPAEEGNMGVDLVFTHLVTREGCTPAQVLAGPCCTSANVCVWAPPDNDRYPPINLRVNLPLSHKGCCDVISKNRSYPGKLKSNLAINVPGTVKIDHTSRDGCF